jgi:hypothetical protein
MHKPVEAHKPAEPKRKRTALEAKKAEVQLAQIPHAGKKGNGHLEDGWKEF